MRFASLTAAALVLSAASASAVTLTAVDKFDGGGTHTVRTLAEITALTALNDGDFYSPGIGGWVVYELSQTIAAGEALVLEVSFSCTGDDGTGACVNWPEDLDVYALSSYTVGDDPLAGTQVANDIGNFEAQGGYTVSINFPFSYLVLADDSKTGLASQQAKINAGYDIEQVRILPVPGALPLLAVGFGLLGVASARRRA